MGSKIKERCIYCGGDVFYDGSESLVKCQWCGQTLAVAKFENELLRIQKAEEENVLIKEQLEEAEKEKQTANDRLFAALSDLGEIRNEQDILGKTISLLINGQEDSLNSLEFLKGISEKLVNSLNDIFAKMDVMQDIRTQLQKMDMAEHERQSAMNEFMLWSQQIQKADLDRLQGIANSADELIAGQREINSKVDELKAAADQHQQTLEEFRGQYTKDKLQKIQKLYRQAEDYQHDRRYDKAEEYYHRVLTEGNEDAEIYWRLIMCHYCLFYEKDDEGRMIPIILNPDLTDPAEMSLRKELVLQMTERENAYYDTKIQEIDRILDKYRLLKDQVQYDVFISVKQDDGGHYTSDSDVASDLYDFLKGQGLRVFNSRRTVIPVGQEYEPYIISALISSKVLIVVGTTPENMNSKWVKNEWSRYQWLQFREKEKTGKTDRVLFCYLAKGMQAEQIPRALHPDRQAIYDGVKAHDELLAGISSLKGMRTTTKTETVLHPPLQDFKPVEDLMKFWLIQGKYDKVLNKYNELTEAGLFLTQVQLHLLALCAEKQVIDVQQVVCSEVILDQEAEFKAAIMLCRSDEEREKLKGLLEKNQEWRGKTQVTIETTEQGTQLEADEEQPSESNQTEEWYHLGLNAEKEDHIEDALQWYNKAAEKGNADAKYRIGMLNQVTNNDEEAVYWYQKAAEAGHPIAQKSLGDCYLFGQGVPEDKEKADIWFKKAFESYKEAAENGNVEAQYELGNCYNLGIGVEIDTTQKAYWYQKAAENGYAEAQYKLGICFYLGAGTVEKPEQAFYWYQKAANQEHLGACNKLGQCYEYGIGKEQDPKQAFYWYQRAAEAGYAEAQERLAMYYEYGEDIEQDYKKAFQWYQRAAESGSRLAQNRLYCGYKQGGPGIEINDSLADDLMEAAESWKNNKESVLSYSMITGLQDYKKAEENELRRKTLVKWFDCAIEAENNNNHKKSEMWLKKAAETGPAEAQFVLAGYYHLQAKWDKWDKEKALFWKKKAAEQGYARAQYDYALNYEYAHTNSYIWVVFGAFPKKEDLKQAYYWFRKAAEQGVADAQYKLGDFYEKGKRVNKDLRQAFFWYKKAAERLNWLAQNGAATFYREGKGGIKDQTKASYWHNKWAHHLSPPWID